MVRPVPRRTWNIDFDERPFLVIWETTQACDLACLHCRASAQPSRNPLELSTEEAKSLIDEIAALKAPLFVMTGGDPLEAARHLRTRPLRCGSQLAAFDDSQCHSAAHPRSHCEADRRAALPVLPSVSTVPPPLFTMASGVLRAPLTSRSRARAGHARSVFLCRSTPRSRAII